MYAKQGTNRAKKRKLSGDATYLNGSGRKIVLGGKCQQNHSYEGGLLENNIQGCWKSSRLVEPLAAPNEAVKAKGKRRLDFSQA